MLSSDPEGSDITKVEVSVNNGHFVSADGTTDWTFTPTLSDGQNKINARAYDQKRQSQ